MPNVFSPNGDGNNDAFVPLKYFGTKAYLTIFNRWGQLVYSTTNLGAGWNGHLSGNPAPEGTYFWMVDPVSGASNFEPKHGYVTLLR